MESPAHITEHECEILEDSSEQDGWASCASESSCSSGRSKIFRMENSPSSYSSLESNCSDKQLSRNPMSMKFPDQNENFMKSQKKSGQKPPIELDDSTCYWIRNKLPKEFRDTLEADKLFDDWLDHCMNRRAIEDGPVILTRAHRLDSNDHLLPYIGHSHGSRRKHKRNMWWRKAQKRLNRIVHYIIRFLRNLISYLQRNLRKLCPVWSAYGFNGSISNNST